MRSLFLAACFLLLAACGGGGDAAPDVPAQTTEAPAHEAPASEAPASETSPPETPAPVDHRPHLFVQIAASTDKSEYEVGEPILVTRVFEDRGPAPDGTYLSQFGRSNYLVIGMKVARSSGLYDAKWVKAPTPSSDVGARVEGVIRVELPGPGTYTLEVPPEYVARSGFGNAIELPVTVVDRGDARYLEAKAERLGRILETENLDFPSCWTEAQGDLRALGPAAIPYLRRWLRESENDSTRAVSAKLLRQLAAREAIGDIVAALGDESAKVRKQCVEVLGGFRDPETLDALLAMTKDSDAWVRIDTYQALKAFEDERVRPALRQGLEDEYEYARISAAHDLASLGDAAGIGVLIEALRRDPSGSAFLVTDSLESLTGRSFGDAGLPITLSCEDQIADSAKECEEIAAKWLQWWEDEGRARFGER